MELKMSQGMSDPAQERAERTQNLERQALEREQLSKTIDVKPFMEQINKTFQEMASAESLLALSKYSPEDHKTIKEAFTRESIKLAGTNLKFDAIGINPKTGELVAGINKQHIPKIDPKKVLEEAHKARDSVQNPPEIPAKSPETTGYNGVPLEALANRDPSAKEMSDSVNQNLKSGAEMAAASVSHTAGLVASGIVGLLQRSQRAI